MYFYVDESGNTGNNLFDPVQPNLYYGLLSSSKNLDVVASNDLAALRTKLGVTRIHASELGNARLIEVADSFVALQKKHDIRFNFYTVVKADHAAMCFFDQVFDSGLNQAVPWSAYWTPLRYTLLAKVAYLFDEEAVKKAWSARIELDDATATRKLIEVCQVLRSRVDHLPDQRSRELITDALIWAERYPERIEYNASFKENALLVSPNLVGFQQVLQGVANRTTALNRRARTVVVDQQNEFNASQQLLTTHYRSFRDVEFQSGPGMPPLDYSGMPEVPLSFLSSAASPGLEMVDVYLWIMKRLVENKPVAAELENILYGQRHRGITDEISLKGIEKRWSTWHQNLPEPTEEQMARARGLIEREEHRRMEALR